MFNRLLNYSIHFFLVTILAGVSFAFHPVFENADTNKDGKIDRAELGQYMKENAFEKLDRDSDESLTYGEWSRADDVLTIEEYKDSTGYIDINRDLKISFPEFSNYIQKYSNIEDAFMVLDRNRDNSLAPDEISYIPSFRLITIHY